MAQQNPEGGPMLSELLAELAEVSPARDRPISGLCLDSREALPGTLFLACQGGRSHGLDFAAEAAKRGAVAIAWESDGESLRAQADGLAAELGLPLLPVSSLTRRASLIAARFHGFPSRSMKVIGITGTNGKTSVSHLLAQAMAPERACGIVGTLGVGYVESLTPTGFTTPDAVTLQQVLADLREQGADAVAMEVSSHALDQGRAAAVHFDTAVFTNISRDHFDYHGDMDSYAAAKRQLFHMPELRCAVVNLDDEMGAGLAGSLAHGVRILSYSIEPRREIPANADGWVRAESVVPTPMGLEIEFDSSWGQGFLQSSLLGRFNAHNLLAVLLVLLDQGWELEPALEKLREVTTVAGRMEAYGGGGHPRVVIDYAHTPDALEKVLLALRSHCSGVLHVVFGCGGDRDRGKRPLMGEIAERLADRLIVTDDNPRTEEGDAIVQEILAGLVNPHRARVQRDRSRAIHQAIDAAMPQDLVLVAGKGHEDYQLIGGKTFHFSDQEQVQSALALWQAGEE